MRIYLQMETPKFSQLRLLYPGYLRHGGRYATDDVMQLVLGVNSYATAALVDRESLRAGASAVRLSWTLNRYGGRHAVDPHSVSLRDTLTGADGRPYIYRSEAFGPYLAARYGAPVVQRLTADDDGDDRGRRRPRRRRKPSWPSLTGRQGIVRLVRYVDGRRDGHVGLWDCDRFYESRDWSLDAHLVTVEFWEAAGPCRFCTSILLLTPRMSSEMCERRNWAWLAGRGRCTESRPELETVNN